MASKQVLRPMQIRIPDGIRNGLKSQARAQERSVNWVVIRLLEQALEQLQQKEQAHG